VTKSTDPRVGLRRSFDQAAAVIEGVPASRLGAPTPCADFNVTDLLGHLVGVGRRVASIGRGEKQEAGLAPVSVGDNEWAKTFFAARQEALDAWEDDRLLGQQVELPFGTFPGALVAQIYLVELVTHTWDLATATGQAAGLDSDLAEAALPVARQIVPPAPRGGDVPFGPVIAVADTAPAYDRLAGYLGRQPG
jgi:uncharacterized protein (TIGR03086 family)